MSTTSDFGFRDLRTSAELLLAPAIPAGRSVANLGTLKLNIGGKGILPGSITKATDITGSIRQSLTNVITQKTQTESLAKSLSATIKGFDAAKHQALQGLMPQPDPLFKLPTTNGSIPGAADFLQFSTLRPGATIPPAFQSMITERKAQLQNLSSRVSSIFSGTAFKGVSIRENMARTPYPLPTDLDIPSVPRLSQGGAIALADSILKDKQSFVVSGVTIGSGKPSFWSRLATLAQVKAVPSLNPVVNQIFKDRRNTGSWSEPASPYAAQFPYNKAEQTESGHLIELDDTPGAERVHIFHRAGSFIEWHPDGTVVYKNMKHAYHITMGDQYIKASGDCHIAVDGNITLYVKGNVNLQSDGELNVQTKKDFNVYADNINLRAKKTFKADGTKMDLRYINLPTGLIPIAMSGGFAPRVNLAAIKADFPGSNIDAVLQQMAKNPLDPKAATSTALRLTGPAVAIPPDNPLSNPGIYTLKTAAAIAYRAYLFDTPEETGDFELYNAHLGLQTTLGDNASASDPRAFGGTLSVPSVVTTPDTPPTPTIDYLNYDTFKGTFAYANSYILAGTTFQLKDLVDLSLYPDIVKPLKEPVNRTASGTGVSTGSGSGSGGGENGGSSGDGGSGGGGESPESGPWSNRLSVVKSVMADYPGLIEDSAAFCDQVIHRLNREDGTNLWGRKARNADGSNKNNDVVTYLLDPSDYGQKKLIDCVGDSDSPNAYPVWNVIPSYEEPGNGYWAPPDHPDRDV